MAWLTPQQQPYAYTHTKHEEEEEVKKDEEGLLAQHVHKPQVLQTNLTHSQMRKRPAQMLLLLALLVLLLLQQVLSMVLLLLLLL